MSEHRPLLDVLLGLAAPGVSVACGVAMRHAEALRHGRPWSWCRLALDLPTVVGMAILASAAGDYFSLSAAQTGGVGVVMGYLGPRAVTDALLPWLARRVGGGKGPTE